MEISVRYVPIKKLNYKPALCFQDKKSRVQCITQDSSRIRVFSVSFLDYVKSRVVPDGATAYSPEHFVEKYIEISSRKPATRAAKELMLKASPRAAELQVESVEESKKVKKTRGKAILRLADRFELDPRKIRKALRKAGLSAPYLDDEPTIRALEKYLKR